MRLSEKKGVQSIIRFLWEAGIKNVVLSPGSRNAPLSLSFANYGSFNIRVIADERVAAYHALGISIYTQQPTVICCTSGTAVLNYAPAIAESYYQHVPLLVITADRPEEWIDQGDGQTIRQKNIFSNYIEKSYFVSGDISSETDLNDLNLQLQEAYTIAVKRKKPVHINVTLQEPLYGLTDSGWSNPAFILPGDQPIKTEESLLNTLRSIYQTSGKVMILAGQMNPDQLLNDFLIGMAENKNVIILTENTANLHSEKFISCIDRCIDGFTEDDKNNFKPGLLITLGGAIVSKKVKAWLRKFKPEHHWKVGEQDLQMDTYKCKTHTVPVSEKTFIQNMLNWKNSESYYRDQWQKLNSIKIKKQESFLSSCDFSDLKAFSILMEKIPSGNLLHLGNSSPVRYAQLFETRKDVIYFSNRGVSGIDGCTSSAAGMSDVSDKCVTLISGDISFFYDSNAFWNDYLKNLKVIVINNGGGGIFRIIDQPDNIKDTEWLFETRHKRKAEGIARAFNINYFAAHNEKTLEEAVKQLYADNFPGILEIFTPTEKNPLILKNYFSHLKSN